MPRKTTLAATDRDELIARLRRVTPASRPRWGTMTAHQMICHLADSFRVTLGERESSSAATPFRRIVAKRMVLHTDLPLPRGVRATPELSQDAQGTSPSEFAADLGALVRLIERSVQPNAPRPNPHPGFGEITRAEWARFNWRHTDHHLKQFGA